MFLSFLKLYSLREWRRDEPALAPAMTIHTIGLTMLLAFWLAVLIGG